MFFNNDNSVVEMMTDEERNNPELLKERQGYKDSPVSVYYGSYKKGIVSACLDCKHKDNCTVSKEVARTEIVLKDLANHPDQFADKFEDLPPEAIEKAKTNIFVIVNCIKKEV